MSEKDLEIFGAIARAELYYAAHPESPSALRCPQLSVRSGVWIASLGRNLREGITGFGPTVEAALRAFDRHYRSALRLPRTECDLLSAQPDTVRVRAGRGIAAKAKVTHGLE